MGIKLKDNKTTNEGWAGNLKSEVQYLLIDNFFHYIGLIVEFLIRQEINLFY